MNIYKRLITITIGRLIRVITSLIPKKKGLIVLGSRLIKEGSNSYELFRKLKKSSQLEIYYVYKGKVISDFLKIIRAEVIIYDSYVTDVSYSFSGGARTLNLWHGLSSKKIEQMITKGKLSFYFNHTISKILFPDLNFKPTAILSCSTEMDEKYIKKAFDTRKSKIIRSPYPRNLNNTNFVEKKFLLWVPTWYETELHPFEKEYIEILSELALQQNLVFLYRPHPNSSSLSISTDPNYSNLNSAMALPHTEILITDVSSIVFDYVLIGGSKIICDNTGISIIKKIRGINEDLQEYYNMFQKIDNPTELRYIDLDKKIEESQKLKIQNLFGHNSGEEELIYWINNG
jgi:hypothetical protein